MSAGRRPRLLVLNQYYWPGVEATAHLLTELCEALVSEFDVTVVTGSRPPDAPPGATVRNGVAVVRVHSASYDRALLSRRAVNYVTYVVQALRAALAAPRPDVVVAMTDPPFIGDIALVVARRFRVPFAVITQDVFPEVAVELRRLENPLLVATLRILVGLYLRRADGVVAIGATMQRKLIEKGARPDRITVIPNWVDAERLSPQPRDNEWAREQGFADRFVVMHSGNIGHAQNLDALVRAGTFLRDLDDLTIAIIGAGARQAEIAALAERLDVDAIRFMGYQPREVLSQSLSSADIHVVGLEQGLAGYVVPSRLYGILAAGRPVIVAAEAESETAQVVEQVGCGIVIPPGRPELLANAIRAARDGEHDLERMGRAGREYVVAEADRGVAVARYATFFRQVARGGRQGG